MLETPDDPAFMAVLSRRSPIIQDGFDYWRSKGWPDRLPGREDIDPMDMSTLLPNVILLDVRQGPLDFFYRLVGTGVVHHLETDLTGSWMSEIEHQRPPSRIWESCERVVTTQCPLLSSIPYVGPHAEYLFGEDIILPLGDESGAVIKLLVFIAYIQKPTPIA
ncbi:MAG: PAS domain-containing protein [Rhodospirillaceae bacterium]|nr:PAS domain-containing protein [Rhodospirillaceae bacterium]